ncbi:hypothetical protein [Rhodococcus sp. KB6]|uniref:hypothetical protein n=1 Tax=Rhodococcus sp. KB6 TaxID=1752066 RepID=UPI000718014B|nr:hypothetical protein [Rhodococcus sp. KB6]
MTHVQNPPIFEELWRNHVAAEIQNHPQRYILGQGIDAEAKALAAGELARLDFEEESEAEPVLAEFTADEVDRVAGDMRSALLIWITCLSLAAFFGFVAWAAVVSA